MRYNMFQEQGGAIGSRGQWGARTSRIMNNNDK